MNSMTLSEVKKKLEKRRQSVLGFLLIVSLCVGCAPTLRKGGFLDDYSSMEFVMGLSGGSFQWVDPAKDLRWAQSIAILDFQHINPVGNTPEEAELRKAEIAAANEIVNRLANRLKSEGILARVERSESAPVDLILRGAVTDFKPGGGSGLRLVGVHGRAQVEALLIEVKTGQVVGRIQATAAPAAGGLLGLMERRPEDEIITQLTGFLRTKVKQPK